MPGTPLCPPPPLPFRRFFPPSLRCPSGADSRSRGLCAAPGPPGAPQPMRTWDPLRRGRGALGPWGTPPSSTAPGWDGVTALLLLSRMHLEEQQRVSRLGRVVPLGHRAARRGSLLSPDALTNPSSLSALPQSFNASRSHLSVPCYLLKVFFIRAFPLIYIPHQHLGPVERLPK